jgi:hypothetical protein
MAAGDQGRAQAAKSNREWFALGQNIDVSLASEEGTTIAALQTALEDDRKLVLQGLMTQAEYVSQPRSGHSGRLVCREPPGFSPPDERAQTAARVSGARDVRSFASRPRTDRNGVRAEAVVDRRRALLQLS